MAQSLAWSSPKWSVADAWSELSPIAHCRRNSWIGFSQTLYMPHPQDSHKDGRS
jgi:hypothetical protein